MGLYDRDYYKTGPGAPPRAGAIGAARLGSATTWLILINIAVFALDFTLLALHTQAARAQNLPPPTLPPLTALGYFSIDTAIAHFQLWRLLTSQFLHTGLLHLAVNMLGLYLFGPVVEGNLGRRQYLFFYLLCGMAGPLLYAVLWAIGILLPHAPAFLLPANAGVPLIGASAAVFGVLVAAAYLSPNRMLDLYFFDLPLRHFAWVMVVVALYTLLVHGPDAGGQTAHLGGALLGFLLIRHDAVLHLAAPKRSLRGKRIKDWSKDPNR